MPLTRAAVIAEARSWVGTPYHKQAYLKGAGCDCIGLARGMAIWRGFDASDANPALRDFLGYGDQPDPVKMKAALGLFYVEIPRRHAKAGDWIWVKIDDEPRHIALLSENGYVIHALSSVGSVREHRMDPKWGVRIEAAWRFPDIET